MNSIICHSDKNLNSININNIEKFSKNVQRSKLIEIASKKIYKLPLHQKNSSIQNFKRNIFITDNQIYKNTLNVNIKLQENKILQTINEDENVNKKT